MASNPGYHGKMRTDYRVSVNTLDHGTDLDGSSDMTALISNRQNTTTNEDGDREGLGVRFAMRSSTTNGSVANPSHCHTDLGTVLHSIDKRARRKLIAASILCLLFTVGEAVGGLLAGSLAIATDSAHMLTDFASFMISLLALYMSARPPSKNFSFGWHRAEIIGALVSVQMIWIVTGVLVYMAVERVRDQSYEIDAITMLITASCAVVVNIILFFTLHGVGHNHSHSHGHSHKMADKTPLIVEDEGGQKPSCYGAVNGEEGDVRPAHNIEESQKPKENLNVRAAFIHVLGDLLQSVGVLIAAIIIYVKPEWKLADPICTFLFSVFVLLTTVNILRDAVRVLMEATPRHIDFTEMKTKLNNVQGVKYVHNLRIWSLTTSKFTMSVHLAIDPAIANSQDVLSEASKLIWRTYGIQDPTIQVEHYAAEMDDCHHCQDLPH